LWMLFVQLRIAIRRMGLGLGTMGVLTWVRSLLQE